MGKYSLLAVLAVSVVPGFGQRTPDYVHKLAPYVASPYHVVERMLELAKIKPGDKVYDLGCGDGRILISAVQLYKAQAVGVEISDKLANETEARIHRLGLDGQAKVIHGDLLDVDFSDADVVTIYLLTASNEQIRPRLEKYLKPGARVVSHDFAVPGWKPKWVDKSEGDNRHLIYVYVMPPVKQ